MKSGIAAKGGQTGAEAGSGGTIGNFGLTTVTTVVLRSAEY